VIRRFALLAAFAALACTAPAAALANSTILVKFASPTGATAKVESLGDQVDGTTLGGVKIVDPQPGESVADALARYQARPDVIYAEPNRIVHLFDLPDPDDTWYADQWALPTISAVAGWSIFPGTFAAPTGAPIGIVDTGIDATHPDLAAKVASSGATCLGSGCGAGTPTDPWGHGTHVSGIAGAATNDGVGVAGLALGSPIIPVRVFHDDGTGTPIAFDSDVANGIAWAATHGARAINLSLGGGYSLTECNAVELAINSYHAVVVAAAGNSGVATPTYPAACPGVVGVAATDDSDLPASFSNYGSPDVFVSAPGVFILSTWPAAIDGDCPYVEPSGYCHLDGTSMAAPYVTALAALIMSEHPEASVSQVKQVLAQSSDKVGGVTYGADPYGFCSTCTWEAHHGYGRINVQRALSMALPPPPPPPAPPGPPAPPPPPASAPDRKAPVVHVYAASGRHRRALHLRYRVQDDRGHTSERLFVYRKTKLLKTFSRSLRTTDDAVAYWVSFRFALSGTYRYCVRATDAAGNRSRLACAAIRIR